MSVQYSPCFILGSNKISSVFLEAFYLTKIFAYITYGMEPYSSTTCIRHILLLLIWNKVAEHQFLACLLCGVCKKTHVSAGNHHHVRETDRATWQQTCLHCTFSLLSQPAWGYTFSYANQNRPYINSQKKPFHVMDCFTIGAFTVMCHWTLRDVSSLYPWSVFEQLSSNRVFCLSHNRSFIYFRQSSLCIQTNSNEPYIEWRNRVSS